MQFSALKINIICAYYEVRNIPCKNLITDQLIADWIRTNFKQLKSLILASPDAGESKTVRHIAIIANLNNILT